MKVERFHHDASDDWDALVEKSWNGTFLHSRRFLSYHGKRFEDVSLLIRDSHDRIVGALPAAVDPNDASQVVSHPGITYGGLVHARDLQGSAVLQALGESVQAFRSLGFRRLVYKPVPRVFHVVAAEDDLYALFRLGAQRSECGLSVTIDLHHRPSPARRRKRTLARAHSVGVHVSRDTKHLSAFWDVLVSNLDRRHGVGPVHTLEEVRDLMKRFPEQIQFVGGKLDGSVVGGALLFVTRRAVHIQYLHSNLEGRDAGVPDLLVEDSISRARDAGLSSLSFGISNEQRGLVLNDNLHRFKTEFGGGGSVHETYVLDL